MTLEAYSVPAAATSTVAANIGLPNNSPGWIRHIVPVSQAVVTTDWLEFEDTANAGTVLGERIYITGFEDGKAAAPIMLRFTEGVLVRANLDSATKVLIVVERPEPVNP